MFSSSKQIQNAAKEIIDIFEHAKFEKCKDESCEHCLTHEPWMHDKSKEIDLDDKTNQEKFEAIDVLKAKGNSFFKLKQFQEAIVWYNKASTVINFLIPDDHEGSKQDNVCVVVNQNIAICHFYLGDQDGCIDFCDSALTYKRDSKKALYFKIKCLLEKSELDEAFHLMGTYREYDEDGQFLFQKEHQAKTKEIKESQKTFAQNIFKNDKGMNNHSEKKNE